jgi:hypothetical protein
VIGPVRSWARNVKSRTGRACHAAPNDEEVVNTFGRAGIGPKSWRYRARPVPDAIDLEASASRAEALLVERLRAGNETAFREVVRRYHASLVRVASSYVPTRAHAEEVAQETWLAMLRGIDRSEGRSSLETWLFRILLNRARTSGVRYIDGT